MLVGYVSDERYVALPDVLVEFESDSQNLEVRSRASGAVYADIEPGEYLVTLAKSGYGSKRGKIVVSPETPHQFRLLKDSLLGYAWPKWVQSGEKAEFRVHSDEQYKLSLWRYGWKKELVQPIGWFDEHGPRATVQITPDGDYTQTGVQWNKFGYSCPHHKQYIEAPERSGLYYFHAKGESGKFFSFPWIVAPAQPNASTAVLLSNINWNAYNNFGGRSNYIHPDTFPPTPTVNARMELRRYTDPDHLNYDTTDYDPLSFDRPEPINHIPEDEEITGPIEGRAPCHIAPTEWRLLGWLEREGLAHDVYAETQLHFDTLNLDNYKLLIISTHPEYWSSEMYFKLKAWVFERGGRLMYLGGNGLNCDVEFIDSQTCIYRNDDSRKLTAEGSKYESRFHLRQESEANLLGVVYDERGIMTAAPYEVVDDSHWVFEGTGLANGDTFGHESQHQRIPGGASGHETDKISPSSPPDTKLLARGLNPGEGGAHMVIHEPGNGAAVFSAGSINWPSSLLVDEQVSKITANVVRRFAS
ncbi:MAG: carboxypeptidase regulatory-like domain-containing protein [Planctomycetes bacterium]|nr:carboxypeptidase regulatory-like domain-containing protein [Planctomycetota bacterium]